MHSRINKISGVQNRISITETINFHLGLALFYFKLFEKDAVYRTLSSCYMRNIF